MKTSAPNIYDYNDFRKFIIDYQKAAIRENKTYTKSHMTKLLGLPNSRSFLSDVLRGKRISDAFIDRFINIFKFNSDEAAYFRALVKYNQCTVPDEKELCFDQMIRLNRTQKKIVDQESFSYYKNWYNAALRALLNIYDFDGSDFQALAKKLVPEVPLPGIKQAFNLLLKLEMISKNQDGFFKPTSRSISTEDFLRDEVLRQFQTKCMRLADYAIANDTGTPKIIAVNTISVSQNGLKMIEKQIEHFRSQVRSIVNKDEEKAEKVYQIDVLFFPMSK